MSDPDPKELSSAIATGILKAVGVILLLALGFGALYNGCQGATQKDPYSQHLDERWQDIRGFR